MKSFNNLDEARQFFDAKRDEGKKYMIFGDAVLDVTYFKHPGP